MRDRLVMKRFKDKVAVITGGAYGIYLADAFQTHKHVFLQQNAFLHLLDLGGSFGLIDTLQPVRYDVVDVVLRKILYPNIPLY